MSVRQSLLYNLRKHDKETHPSMYVLWDVSTDNVPRAAECQPAINYPAAGDASMRTRIVAERRRLTIDWR